MIQSFEVRASDPDGSREFLCAGARVAWETIQGPIQGRNTPRIPITSLCAVLFFSLNQGAEAQACPVWQQRQNYNLAFWTSASFSIQTCFFQATVRVFPGLCTSDRMWQQTEHVADCCESSSTDCSESFYENIKHGGNGSVSNCIQGPFSIWQTWSSDREKKLPSMAK